MEIPLSRFQNLSLDQIQTTCLFAFTIPDSKFCKREPFFSGYCFSFNRTRRRHPLDRIKCSSADQRLRPKPKPKPSRTELDRREETRLEDNQMRKPGSLVLCGQIEKLVLCGRYREALDLFEILELQGECDVGSSTYDTLVTACVGLRSVRGVKRVFNYMKSSGFEPDLYMRNRVLLMHLKCGMMIDARKLFDEMSLRDLTSWDTMIAGVVEWGNYKEAFQLFKAMWQEYSDCGFRTFATMIRASAGLELISVGQQLHSCALKVGVDSNIFVTCALIDMYSKCGSIEDAQFVFDEMPEKTTVGWNTIIAGYALHGYSEQALEMYYEMRDSGVRMDHFTFSILVRICARLASVEHAKQAHAGLVRHGFGSDMVANTTLVDFYSKWGKIEDARNIFNKMPLKNIISWNALIFGYGKHGEGSEAVKVFEQMLREGMKPNHVTFLAVLSACSYSGLSEHGWEIFQSMARDHKIKPRAMHYACMIELLGQDGLLDEAFALIRSAPFKPTANMWGALLTACRVHGNLELGKYAAEKLYGMEPEKLSNYIVLLNIYNSSGRTKEAAAVLQTLKRKGLTMLPACSWVEIRKQPHVFYSNDKSHAQTKEIFQKVDELMLKISKQGYVPEEKHLLPDVDEREKKNISYHSEKLAIAFGLINTPDRTSLQIVQTHRLCGDCHNSIKLITTVTGREIVVRDASRFHHFKDGRCSCGDYW